MSRRSSNDFKLVSRVGRRNRVPLGVAVQHRVKVVNYLIVEVWAGFVSETRDDLVAYAGGRDRWRPQRARLDACDGRSRGYYRWFVEADGQLTARTGASPGETTQLWLQPWRQRRGPAHRGVIELPWDEMPENLTIKGARRRWPSLRHRLSRKQSHSS